MGVMEWGLLAREDGKEKIKLLQGLGGWVWVCGASLSQGYNGFCCLLESRQQLPGF